MDIILQIEAKWAKQKGDLTDKNGILLSAVITSANKRDIKAVTKMLSIILLSNDLLNHLLDLVLQLHYYDDFLKFPLFCHIYQCLFT